MRRPRHKKPPLPTEHALQSALIEYLVLAANDCYFFAIPNAGKRTPAAGARMKAEGLSAGVADLCFLLPDGKCAWLELKRSPRHKQSPQQRSFHDICAVLGHPYAVAHSFDEAVEILCRWEVIASPRKSAPPLRG